jgi:hypothetical protein
MERHKCPRLKKTARLFVGWTEHISLVGPKVKKIAMPVQGHAIRPGVAVTHIQMQLAIILARVGRCARMARVFRKMAMPPKPRVKPATAEMVCSPP